MNQNDAKLSTTGVLVGFLLAAAAVADGPSPDCATVEPPEQRLACYDAAAASGKPDAPKDEEFGAKKSKQDLEGESLISGIVALNKDDYGKLIVELENGQVWRQVENRRFAMSVGQVVEIRHGALGLYKLYIQGGNNWTRVRREQ